MSSNRYEKEFDKVNDVFELQVRLSHHTGGTHQLQRFGLGAAVKLLDERSFHLTYSQRNLNNCFAYDLVPSPSVITAAVRAARRVNDFPSAVRVFEGTFLAIPPQA